MVVDGVFTSDGLSLFMDSNIFADYNYVSNSIGYVNEEATEVVISLNGKEKLATVMKSIEQAIVESGLDLRVSEWYIIAKTYNSIIAASTFFPMVVMVLTFLVVGIGLLNSIIMTILERTKETKIVIALGTSRKRILGQFFLEFLILGIVASFIAICISIPTILILGKVGIPATTSVIEYIFGGDYLYMVLKPVYIIYVFLIFSFFPAIIAFFVAKSYTKGLSLVNII